MNVAICLHYNIRLNLTCIPEHNSKQQNNIPCVSGLQVCSELHLCPHLLPTKEEPPFSCVQMVWWAKARKCVSGKKRDL